MQRQRQRQMKTKASQSKPNATLCNFWAALPLFLSTSLSLCTCVRVCGCVPNWQSCCCCWYLCSIKTWPESGAGSSRPSVNPKYLWSVRVCARVLLAELAVSFSAPWLYHIENVGQSTDVTTEPKGRESESAWVRDVHLCESECIATVNAVQNPMSSLHANIK